MALPAPVSNFLHANQDILLSVILLLNLALLAVFFWTAARLGRLHRVYYRLTRGTSGGNLEEVLQEHIGSVEQVAQRLGALEQAAARLEEKQLGCLQRVGVVRFDAFDDVGGEQSFAVAALDARRNGLVISSVFSRTDVRVYAKSIQEGRPSHPLTDEEQQAMALAEKR